MVVKQPKTPVTDNEVKQSVHLLSRNGRYNGSDDAHKILKEYHLTPHELIGGVLGVDATKPFRGRIELSVTGDRLHLTGENIKHSKTGAEIIRCHRIIDLKQKTVGHEFLKLESGSQGANTVKDLFKSALPVYDQLGMKEIKLHANLSAGGYAWAKYGFKPDNKWEIQNTVEIAQRRLDIFIKDAKVTDPKTLKEHAALTKLLSKPINDKIIRKIANVKTEHLDEVLNEYPTIVSQLVRERNFPPNFKMSAAKFMLINASWDGTLELKGESLKRLKTYINQ